MVRTTQRNRFRRGLCGDRRGVPLVVDDHQVAVEEAAHAVGEARLCDHGQGARVAGDVRQSLVRVHRVERQIRRPGLQYAQQRRDQLKVPLQRDADQDLRAGAQLTQVMGEAVRPLVHLGIGQGAVPADHGDLVRGPGGLRRERLVDTPGDRKPGRGVPAAHQLVGLGVRQEVHRGEPGLRGGGEAVEQADVVVRHALGGLACEERGGEDQPGVERALPGILHVQCQVGLDDCGARDGLHVEAGQFQARALPLAQDEVRLVEGAAGQVPFRLQLVDEAGEGDRLVLEGVQDRAAAGGEQLVERGVAAPRGTGDQHIDAVADESLELGAVASGDGGAHGDVRGPGVPGQQDLEGGEKDDEPGDSAVLGQLSDALGQVGRDGEVDARTAGVAEGGALVIGGQFQHGQRRQLFPPVGQFGFQRLVGEFRALPGGVVRVLEGKRFQLGCTAGGVRGVQAAQLVGEHAHRPGVTGDVVEGHHQHVVGVVQLEQLGPHRPVPGQVEGDGRLLLRQFPRALGTPVRRHIGQADDRKLQPPRRVHHLDGFLTGQDVPGAEDLVPGDDAFQGRAQRLGVQRPPQAGRQRYEVFGAVGSHLVEEPHLLLPEGQQQRLVAIGPGHP